MNTFTLTHATNFAAKAHKDQRRKNANADPYINHPIEVAEFASSAALYDNVDPNTITSIAAAAYLHDTVEDCSISLDEIRAEFGPGVATLVDAVTDNKFLSKINRKKLQIDHAETISLEAGYVKLADKLSNTRSLMISPPENWSADIIQGYLYWSYAVVNAIYTAHPDKYQWFKNRFNWYGMDLEPSNVEHELYLYYQRLKAAEARQNSTVTKVTNAAFSAGEILLHPLVVGLVSIVFTSFVFRLRK